MTNYTQQKNEFNEIIATLMDKIDIISQKLNTQEYIELANGLRDLNALSIFKEIQTITQTIQQQPHYQRIRETITFRQKPQQLKAKIDDPKYYKFCERCDSMVCRDGFKKHQNRAICKKIHTSKLTTKNSQSTKSFHKIAQVLTPQYERHYNRLKDIIFLVYNEEKGYHKKNIADVCGYIMGEENMGDEDETYTNIFDYYRLDKRKITWIKENGKWIADTVIKCFTCMYDMYREYKGVRYCDECMEKAIEKTKKEQEQVIKELQEQLNLLKDNSV